MNKSRYVSRTNITADYTVAIHQNIGIHRSLCAVVIGDLICIPHNLFLFIVRKIQPLTFLNFIVTCKDLIKFRRDGNLHAFNRIGIDFPTKLLQKFNPIFIGFDLIVIDIHISGYRFRILTVCGNKGNQSNQAHQSNANHGKKLQRTCPQRINKHKESSRSVIVSTPLYWIGRINMRDHNDDL